MMNLMVEFIYGEEMIYCAFCEQDTDSPATESPAKNLASLIGLTSHWPAAQQYILLPPAKQ